MDLSNDPSGPFVEHLGLKFTEISGSKVVAEWTAATKHHQPYGIVFGALGAARDCLDSAIGYAADREIFDKPLAGYQLTQAKLVEMAVKVGQSTLLALHLGRLKDAGQLSTEQVSFGKYHNVSAAMEVVRSARTVLGANGITLEYPVLRHANNLESVLTYEGTHEMHTLILGNAITGLPAFT